MTIRLYLDITIGFPEFEMQVRFDQPISVLAVTGRSGIGKTSLLNTIAGLVKPARGTIALGETTLFDSDQKIDLPAYQRQTGYVFQDARLFPHLTVSQNLGYAEWLARRRKPIIARNQLIDLLDIGDKLARYPQNLSGGERQRVAIARALLAAPRLLLLDEPISAVDRQRGTRILSMLKELKHEIRVPMILVSHNRDDIAAISDIDLDLETNQDTRILQTQSRLSSV